MTSEQFVDAINKVVVESAINSVQLNLVRPPGRQPSERLLAMSNWYNRLDESDRKMISQVIQEAVETGIFGFMCVLDGVRAIESNNKGELKLYYENGEKKVLLNDAESVSLHELL